MKVATFNANNVNRRLPNLLNWLAKARPDVVCQFHAPAMFVISEVEAAAIRTALEQSGELAAAVELRRLFPLITDTMQARECARAIASWKPLPTRPPKRPSRRREPEQ